MPFLSPNDDPEQIVSRLKTKFPLYLKSCSNNQLTRLIRLIQDKCQARIDVSGSPELSEAYPNRYRKHQDIEQGDLAKTSVSVTESIKL